MREDLNICTLALYSTGADIIGLRSGRLRAYFAAARQVSEEGEREGLGGDTKANQSFPESPL